MKVLFFSRDAAAVEEMVLALRLRWPDIQSTAVDNADKGLHIIEQQEPELAIVCDDLADMTISEIIKEIRRFADTPIIVAAKGNGEMDIQQGFCHLDMNQFLSEPKDMTLTSLHDSLMVRHYPMEKLSLFVFVHPNKLLSPIQLQLAVSYPPTCSMHLLHKS